MDQYTALKNLAKLIQDDNAETTDFRAIWPGGPELITVLQAYRDNSVDTTNALKDMLFPFTSQYSIVTDPTCVKATMAAWPKGLSGGVEVMGEAWSQTSGGRALLGAVVNAYAEYVQPEATQAA